MLTTINPSCKDVLMQNTPGRRPITRKDCEFLETAGLLDGRYELIDGEIISKMGQKPLHAFIAISITSTMSDGSGCRLLLGTFLLSRTAMSGSGSLNSASTIFKSIGI